MFGPSYSYDALATWSQAIGHGHGAGLPLVRVFEMQAKSGPLAFREIARRIITKLEAGETLEDSLAAEGANLPELFVSLAAVGERSGRIPDVFAQLKEYYHLQHQLKREFRSQIAWPVFQFVAGVLVIAFTIFVLGLLAPDNPAQPIGFGLSGTSGAILFLLVVGATVGAALLALKIFTRTLAKREGFEAWLLRVPIFGPCARSIAMGRFCLALKLTLDSSLSVSKAMRMSLKATGNSAFKAQADRIAKRIQKGEEIAEAMRTNPIFPAEFLAMITIGEESGQIPEVMAKQAEFYREESARRMKAATRALAVGVYGLVALFMIIMIFRMAGTYIQALGG